MSREVEPILYPCIISLNTTQDTMHMCHKQSPPPFFSALRIGCKTFIEGHTSTNTNAVKKEKHNEHQDIMDLR